MTALRRCDPAAFLAETARARRFSAPPLEPAAAERLGALIGRPVLSADDAVRAIVDDVRDRGDVALRTWTRHLDGVDVADPHTPTADLAAAWQRMPAERREAWTTAAERIRAFHRSQQSLVQTIGAPGLRLRPTPVRRAGCYVPGGRAAYPSTVLMTVIPAVVAGVESVAVASPPGPDGRPHPEVLAAAHLAGAHEVLAMGGAQAIAALAHGTETVAPVDVVVGPGNLFVTLAKRAVTGAVGIDGLAGPSEILVVAGRDADPEQVAADLLSQLEHDPLAWAVLLCTDEALAAAVEAAFAQRAETAERAGVIARSAERHGRSVVCADMEEALRLCNAFAPEHLELVGRDAEALEERVVAGAVFVGAQTPVAMGDYIAGPNHTLPTGGAARFSGPLSLLSFTRWSSHTRLDAAEMAELGPVAQLLSEAEGLHAHTQSIGLRLRARNREEGEL